MIQSLKTENFKYIYIPAVDFGQTNANKVMIVMHGLGDSKDSYVDFCKELNVPGLHYLIIDGPIPYFFGNAWYDPPPENPNKGIRFSLDKINLLIEELKKQGLSSEDIFLTGFSQGGCIALEYLYQCKEKLGGIIALSPKIYPLREDFKPDPHQLSTPIFLCHGLYDEVIPYQEMETRSQSLIDKGLKVFKRPYPIEHDIDITEIEDLRSWINELL